MLSSDQLNMIVRRLDDEYGAATGGIRAVVQEVLDARTAVVALHLEGAEAMSLVELVARQRLDLRCGRVEDSARVLGTRRRTRAQMVDLSDGALA